MGTDNTSSLASTTHAARACRSLVMGWTDAQSGERLIVEVSGPSTFLQNLNEHGFEVLTDVDPGSPERWGRRGAVVAVARAVEPGAHCGGPVQSQAITAERRRRGA